MKLYTLLAALTVTTPLVAHCAETVIPAVPAPAPVAAVAVESNIPVPLAVAETPPLISRGPNGIIIVRKGRLSDLVLQLEDFAGDLQNGPDGPAVSPNVVFGPGAGEAVLQSDLRLRKVTPLEAVTLISAAAGCTIQAVVAPTGAEPVISGYRIVLEKSAVRTQPATFKEGRLIEAGELGSGGGGTVLQRYTAPAEESAAKNANSLTGVGIVLSSTIDGPQLREVVPNSPAARAHVKTGSLIASVDGKSVAGMALDKVVGLIRGNPGTNVTLGLRAAPDSGRGAAAEPPVTIELKREPIPLLAPRAVAVLDPGSSIASGPGDGIKPSNTALKEPPLSFVLPNALDAAAEPMNASAFQPRGPFVKVYGLGSVLIGQPRDVVEKQQTIQDLIAVAVRTDGDDNLPDLSFHTGLKALIVKGTAKQHELIAQIVGVLKENAAASPK